MGRAMSLGTRLFGWTGWLGLDVLAAGRIAAANRVPALSERERASAQRRLCAGLSSTELSNIERSSTEPSSAAPYGEPYQRAGPR